MLVKKQDAVTTDFCLFKRGFKKITLSLSCKVDCMIELEDFYLNDKNQARRAGSYNREFFLQKKKFELLA